MSVGDELNSRSSVSTYLVIGASGKTGRYVAHALLERGASVRAGSRTPERLTTNRSESIRFDWYDRLTWLPALQGVDGVYLVKPESEDVVALVSDFIEAMGAEGVRRLVLVSECAAGTRPPDVAERAAELVVEAADLDWTILRPSWYMQDLVEANFFGSMIRDDRLVVMTTGGERIAWIDARDVGIVAASLLVTGGAVGEALDLTGPEALTLEELAARISRVAGTGIVGVEEPAEQAIERMRQSGMSDDEISYMTRISDSIASGHTSTVTSEVRRFAGRAAESLDAFLLAHEALLTPKDSIKPASGPSDALDGARHNEALFRRLIGCWATNDLDGLLECFDDDLQYTDMPFPDQPVRGKDAFRRHMVAYNSLFREGQVNVEFVQVVANSTNVIGELLCRALYVGPGAPPEGVPVTWCATISDTVVGGRVAYERAYYDPAAFDNAVARARE